MMRDIEETTCQSCNGHCCGNGRKLTNGNLKPVSSLGDLVQWNHIDEDEKPSIFWYDKFECVPFSKSSFSNLDNLVRKG